jgi:hypothetical protein
VDIEKNYEKIKKYVDEEQKKYEAFMNSMNKESNEVFRELVRQLILVATVFLSISIFALNFKELNSIFDTTNKHLLMYSWVFIGASIIFGITQFIIDYYFFAKWSDISANIVNKLSTEEFKDEDSCYNEISKELKSNATKSNTVFVFLQISFLSIGIILLIIFMIRALFSL